ncbi:hypothetical protein C5167_004012 [Papaver somniferum]|uniref:ferritin-3, chloroplastic-like n=1 Tax=Papaver somniferum TaxID=3469 RepID=UPI000E6FFA16|nr:ferritin-3, chloroplastic-like [Papaver somniferum]RZC92831.1 hypothetical protein C5167_004012 [Papaver somniferum]
MLLRASSPSTAFSLSTAVPDNVNQFPSSSSSSVSFSSSQRRTDGFVVSVLKNESNNNLSPGTTAVVFKPFEEIKKELQLLSALSQQSLARHKFSNACEAAINDQINWEYNLSYVYHSAYAYFDRDYVALEGFAKFFREAMVEKRERAELLMKYQNKRGGRVKLDTMLMPESELYHSEKGEALYSMELALSLEKSTNMKLFQLHGVADENNDVQMAEFIESTFLTEQVEIIKKISEFVSQLRRIRCKGYGVWHFDQMLLNA